MTKRKIYFRADAGANIGYGHFIRTLALADMLKDDFDCTFFTQSPTPYQISEMDKVCAYVPLQPSNKLEDFLNHLSGDEIVVLDNYFYTTEYQRQIKAKGCKLVCIDDMHDKHYVADVVINHGISTSLVFSKEDYTKLCLGFDWSLLRKPFLNNCTTRKRERGSWLVSFGGSDYLNLTEKFVKLICHRDDVTSIIVIIGDAYQFQSRLESYPKVQILKNLTAYQMASCMQKCEYAILPSSGICIEAFSQGCKIYSGYYVDNQKEIYNELAKCGAIVPLEDLTNDIEIDTSISRQMTASTDFENIPKRYIKLFGEL